VTRPARKSTSAARTPKLNMSKTGFVSQMGNDASQNQSPGNVLVDEIKQGRHRKSRRLPCAPWVTDNRWADFSLHDCFLYGKSKAELDQLVGEFTSIFTNADGNLFAENL